MHICDACGAEFETLSELRMRHDCPVKEEQRKREQALEYLRDERGLEIGDLCRVVKTGTEVEIVDVEPAEGDDEEPTVVWVPANRADTPQNQRTGSVTDLI
ncbi:hypothetical protein KY092_14835 [Natronomonas gomsonensis]|jgi:hypothetical protein|uniref:hypothetical protein n=1 Tax=Natronomonas gomsonensis TaxID=1046043 RepID=UPI0020CA5E0D|nr:hypothetical protein [Natronomonas gomsonensis]MCY4731833.1 hypothetical protein [Natronomonas gomsonensis]